MESIEFYKKEWRKHFGSEAPKNLCAEEMKNIISDFLAEAENFPEEARQNVQPLSEDEKIETGLTFFGIYDLDRDGVFRGRDMEIAIKYNPSLKDQGFLKALHLLMIGREDGHVTFEEYYHIIHGEYPDPSKVSAIKNKLQYSLNTTRMPGKFHRGTV